MRVDTTPVVLLDRLPLPAGTTGFDADPAWSSTNPNQLALARYANPNQFGSSADVWLATLAITNTTATVTSQHRLTTSDTQCGTARNYTPAWSPDGKQLAYVALRLGGRGQLHPALRDRRLRV